MGEAQMQLIVESGKRRDALVCIATQQTKSGTRLRFAPRDADAVPLPANLCVTRRGAGVWTGNVEQLVLDFGVVPLYTTLRLQRVADENCEPEPLMFEMDLGDSDDVGGALQHTAQHAASTRAKWLCGTLDLLPLSDARSALGRTALLSGARASALVGPRGVPEARVSWAARLTSRTSPPVARAQRRRRAGTSPPIAIARANSLSVARGERVADAQPVNQLLLAAVREHSGGDDAARVFTRDMCSLVGRRGHFSLQTTGASIECVVRATCGSRCGELFALELRAAIVTLTY